MTLGARIREERQRLGLNQTDFAALASASRRAMVNWEADGAAPSATALMSWGEAGADALYILTGRRMADAPDLDSASHEEDLADIRRELLNVTGYPRPGEPAERAAERLLLEQVRTLNEIIEDESAYSDPVQIEEARNLLAIASDPRKLAAYRAADYAQLRDKRNNLREMMDSWLDLDDLRPSETAMNLMIALCLNYGVPLASLMELMHRLLGDGAVQALASAQTSAVK